LPELSTTDDEEENLSGRLGDFRVRAGNEPGDVFRWDMYLAAPHRRFHLRSSIRPRAFNYD
jgi:hypothetical protein